MRKEEPWSSANQLQKNKPFLHVNATTPLNQIFDRPTNKKPNCLLGFWNNLGASVSSAYSEIAVASQT